MPKCDCGNEKDWRYMEQTFSNGTVHYKRICHKCGAILSGYAPHLEVNPNKFDDEKVADFVMPFGKHKDKTLVQIGKDDYDYLFWAVENIKNENIRKRIELFLTPCKVTWDYEKPEKIIFDAVRHKTK